MPSRRARELYDEWYAGKICTVELVDAALSEGKAKATAEIVEWLVGQAAESVATHPETAGRLFIAAKSIKAGEHLVRREEG